MTQKDKDKINWEATTWEGNRKAQLRHTLKLSVQERLKNLEDMYELNQHMQKLRQNGKVWHNDIASVQESRGTYSQKQGNELKYIPLYGCTPSPLASYLKALGILRLIAEQADEMVKGYWQDEHFVLVTKLDQESLHRFFLKEYSPTPLVAPWGARSGFYPKKI